MPCDIAYADYFGLDKFAAISCDNSPRFAETTIEENEEYRIFTSRWGATMKTWKQRGGVPEFLDFKITSPESWKEAKIRMKPDEDRIDWNALRKNYKTWRKEGRWINAVLYEGEPAALWQEMETVIPAMKARGGHIFSTDHSVPDTVTVETFRQVVEKAKTLGSYT